MRAKLALGFRHPYARSYSDILNKPQLFAYTSFGWGSSLYAMIFFQSLINAYLKQKQRSSVWSLAGNASFHGKFGLDIEK